MRSLTTFWGELGAYLILWGTQAFSSFGSSMTGFALIIWSYERYGSALTTALLSVCSYAPYVLFSIFAGSLSDKWNKKRILLVCNGLSLACSVLALALLATDHLVMWQIYGVNALNGLIGTVRQPASEVATSLLIPRRHYQRMSGVRSFSGSLITLLAPAGAAALLSVTGLWFILAFDVFTFAAAFFSLLFWVHIPTAVCENEPNRGRTLALAKSGLVWLRSHRGIFDLILLLAVINLTASAYDVALPAMLLSRADGGTAALGVVSAVVGVTTMAGSVLASLLPPPKSRARVIFNTLMFSMGTENFILALGRSVPLWCVGGFLGWLFIPLMNAQMDVLLRLKIPVEMQGRVFAARNTFQFFTIPIGTFFGGFLVDQVFEPFMAAQSPGSLWVFLFGAGKGSGAAMFFLCIGFIGALSCLPFRRDKRILALEEAPPAS